MHPASDYFPLYCLCRVCTWTQSLECLNLLWLTQRLLPYIPLFCNHENSHLGGCFLFFILIIRKFIVSFSFPFFLSVLWPHLWYMEIPRLGVKSELQLPAYATATATPDPYPTEWGQGSNPHPHGHYVRSLTNWATTGTPTVSFWLCDYCPSPATYY